MRGVFLLVKSDPGVFSRILHAFIARAPGFEENARLPSLNERISTSESKQRVFVGFLQ